MLGGPVDLLSLKHTNTGDHHMSNLPTRKDTGTVPADFSGIIYNDTGRLNYAAAVNGKLLRRKDGKVRWFKYEMEAGRAAYHELHKG
jgi:hypothetical protein